MQIVCMTNKTITNFTELMLAVKCCLQVLSKILEMSPGSTAISSFIWTHFLATPNYPLEVFGLAQCRYSEAEKRNDDN